MICDEILGTSAARQKVLSHIPSRPTDASVLVTGETGTAKELVAGTAKDRASHTRPLKLWVQLWVDDFGSRRSLDRRRPVAETSHIDPGLILTSSSTAEETERRGLVPAIILPPGGCCHFATVGAGEI